MGIFIWLLIIIAIYYFLNAMDNKKNKEIEIREEKEPTDELVNKVQTSFEKEISQDHYEHLPDSISGREIYIYKKLMRAWYQKLSSKFRYDEKTINKIRKDWVDYIELLKDSSTSHYLWLEAEDDSSEADSLREDHVSSTKKCFLIEDAFSELMGKSEKKEISKTREMPRSAFSRKGEITPEQ